MDLTFTHPSRKKPSWFARLINSVEDRRPSDRLVLRVLFFCIIAGVVLSALSVNRAYLFATPVAGGTLVEGIVGTPRFVNPVLAVTRADQDLTTLIYSGLMTLNPEGELVPDVAESITVSDDGTVYNVIVRKDIRFHDGTPLTARDVAFTIGLIQNPDLKSPLRGNWAGVTVEEIGEYELNIVLDEPYTPFIENFTVGIMPRHIWSDLSIIETQFSQRNTEPIGSGPFKIVDVVENEAGLIDAYELEKANSEVKLDGVTVKFFADEAALATAFKNGLITSTVSLNPSGLDIYAHNSAYTLVTEPLPRVFAIFFNQNKSPAIRDVAVREALSLAVDRDAIIETALGGYGVPIANPIPGGSNAVDLGGEELSGTTTGVAAAEARLVRAGWNKTEAGTWEKRIDGSITPLTVTIRTANLPLFEATTGVLADAWRAFGVTVEVEQYQQSDLVQAVIRPRDFEALLFGIDMNRTVDLYPFWHSSQREDPGFNISQYTNREVDTLLEDARRSQSATTTAAKNAEAMDIISREYPAIALYVPTMTYIHNAEIITPPMKNISKPQERFMNIEQWHMVEEERWPIFQ